MGRREISQTLEGPISLRALGTLLETENQILARWGGEGSQWMVSGHEADGKDGERGVGEGCHAQEGRLRSAPHCQETRGPGLGGAGAGLGPPVHPMAPASQSLGREGQEETPAG